MVISSSSKILTPFLNVQQLGYRTLAFVNVAIHPIAKKCSTSIIQCAIFGKTFDRVDHAKVSWVRVSFSHDHRLKKHCSKITKRKIKHSDYYAAVYLHVSIK